MDRYDVVALAAAHTLVEVRPEQAGVVGRAMRGNVPAAVLDPVRIGDVDERGRREPRRVLRVAESARVA
jgi:hypothetical protein